MSEHKLQGRVALVTGSSRGLGKAMALALGGAGASLALVARDEQALQAVAAEARKLGVAAEVFVCDVAGEASVIELEKNVIARFGRLDILINNAGINIRKDVTDFSLEEWNSVIATNLTSAFLMCRSFVPHMKARRWGRIVNLCSTMSHVSLPMRAAYSASKTGLLGFTRALALELTGEGVTVNGISPGPFLTEMNAALLETPEVTKAFLAKVPLGRWGKLEEIGALALFLCSEEAGYITGTDILIDGGWCAQ
ncbi:MAG: SDR family NAD(P)-dependent oxidoreductase [Bryobacterales bacterium]|nr:SDR family NAD(P)-dependent oxidoreductase [Bryobacterales bacterium]